MELKYLVLFLLAGLVAAEEDYEECGEDEIEACIHSYVEYAVSKPSEEESCSQIQKLASCIRDAIVECEPGAMEDNEDEDIAALENIISINCRDAADALDINEQKCFKDQDTYFMECLPEALQETVELVTEHEGADENVITCSLYTLSYSCAVKRVEDKCGQQAKDDFIEKFKEVPAEVKEACLSESNIKFFGDSLLEKRKRKK